MKPVVLFSHKCGQLGNRLFAFAHLIASAEANNYTVVNLAFDEYAQYFQTTSQDIYCRYPVTSSKAKSNKIRSFLFQLNRGVLKLFRVSSLMKGYRYEVVIADLPDYQFNENRYYQLQSPEFKSIVSKKKWVFLFGRFFRDYSGIVKYQNRIREFFVPIPSLQQNVTNFLLKVRRSADLIIGVHIRRGDYQQFAGGKFFFSQAEYLKKMQELQNNEPERKIAFVICSNEEVDIDLFKGLVCYKGPGHLVEDMYTFAGCDFLMGPPSTYTRWASFYGNVPLLQMNDLITPARLGDFVVLPPEKLFDF